MARKGLTQEKIIAAAIILIEEKGYENFSLRELAAKLEVKAASLYNHFVNVEELKAAIGLTALAQLQQEQDFTIRQKASREEKLLAVAKAYQSFIVMHPELFKFLLGLQKLPQEALQEPRKAWSEQLNRVLDLYQLSQEQKQQWTAIFFGTVIGMALWDQVNPDVENSISPATFAMGIENVIGTLATLERMNRFSGKSN